MLSLKVYRKVKVKDQYKMQFTNSDENWPVVLILMKLPHLQLEFLQFTSHTKLHATQLDKLPSNKDWLCLMGLTE